MCGQGERVGTAVLSGLTNTSSTFLVIIHFPHMIFVRATTVNVCSPTLKSFAFIHTLPQIVAPQHSAI